jgi:hypothetical protein
MNHADLESQYLYESAERAMADLRGLTIAQGRPARLRTVDGRYVFVEWLPGWLSPDVWRDRAGVREWAGWEYDEAIVRAVDWFLGRGCRG